MDLDLFAIIMFNFVNYTRGRNLNSVPKQLSLYYG